VWFETSVVVEWLSLSSSGSVVVRAKCCGLTVSRPIPGVAPWLASGCVSRLVSILWLLVVYSIPRCGRRGARCVELQREEMEGRGSEEEETDVASGTHVICRADAW